jgi:hypothetical protein
MRPDQDMLAKRNKKMAQGQNKPPMPPPGKPMPKLPKKKGKGGKKK